MNELDKQYQNKINELMSQGALVKPRGMATMELQASQLRLFDSSQNILTLPSRKVNYAFAVAEWLWMMFGRDDVKFVSAFNKKIADYSDDGVTFFGAYGPRIAEQLEYVCGALKGDHDTRQAIMTTWRPNPSKTKDVPCTLIFHFMIREGRLNLIVTMRSNDVWLGTPYDTFNFTQIQNFVAGLLGLPRGSYILTADSFHIYEQHWAVARDVYEDRDGIFVRTNDIELMPVASHSDDRDMDTYWYYKAMFASDAADILTGTLTDSRIALYPVGIREHIDFLNRYSRRDGSHKQNEFWAPLYQREHADK